MCIRDRISWCLPSKFCTSRRQILTVSFVKSSIQMRAASYSLPVLRCSDVTRTSGASGNFPWKKEKYNKEAIAIKMAFYCILEILLHVKFTATRQISLSSLYMESFYVSFLFLPLCDFRAYGIGKTHSLALFHPYGGKFCSVHYELKNPARFIELFLFVLTNFNWKTWIKL